VIDIPDGLAAAQEKFNGAAGRAFIAGLPELATEFLERWELRLDGDAMHGVAALVLPVLRTDGTGAVLKLQLLDEESAGEPVALRVWNGDGAVRLLDHDEPTGTMLLERLDPARMLSYVPDTHEAVLVIARLLAHLTSVPAPAGMRRLGDMTRAMLERTPWALERITDPEARRLIGDCAAAVREVADEPGDRLLHWDLHYDNVLAADRAPWLAIDPKPLAGDPGFDLAPALWNRWDDVVATGDVPRAVLRRFDLMVDGLGLDPRRAAGWTLGRVLQNALWAVKAGERELDQVGIAVAEAVRVRS